MDIITYPGHNLIEIGATPKCLSWCWSRPCDLLTELLNGILAILSEDKNNTTPNYYTPRDLFY